MTIVDVMSDLHSGSVYGITPPDYWKASKYRASQEETWDQFVRLSRKWGRPDVLLLNGDAIEGNQSRQGGAELITPDRSVQCDMALEAVEVWRPKRVYASYGTPYHVGEKAEDFERGIIERLNDRGIPAEVEGHLYLNIEGMVFDVRHKIGTSVIPHGRATSLLREMMWSLLKEANETGPEVDVIIRSHAHYHIYLEVPGKKGLKHAFITPGLQLARGRFGARECTGEVHWGMIRLHVDKGKIVRKDVEICNLKSNRPRIIRVK